MNPHLDTNDIETSSRQIELLIQAACPHDCTHIIRSHAAAHLLNFGRALFSAIMQDPPRWLNIGLELQSSAIFQEAIVHIVGQYPNWPWNSFNKDELDQSIRDLIERKAREIYDRQIKIDASLFISTINISQQNVVIRPDNKTNWDSWFIVQYWRDWFCRTKAATISQDFIDGTVYRILACGGDVYLTPEYVHRLLKHINGVFDWGLEAVTGDLDILKNFAAKEVKDLVINRSMLDVEKAGIKYLTCAVVGKHELPWDSH